MSKLKAFLKLDFMTIRPYIKKKDIILPALYILFVLFGMGTVSAMTVVFMGRFVCTVITGKAFNATEKVNMDTLYSSLAIDRKTAVLGRYISTLLLNVAVTTVIIALTVISVFAAGMFGNDMDIANLHWMAIFLVPLFMVVQAIELPILFRVGYSKASIVTMMPMMLLGMGVLAAVAFGNMGAIREFDFAESYAFTSLFNVSTMLVILAVGVVVTAVSYMLSVKFYKQREF